MQKKSKKKTNTKKQNTKHKNKYKNMCAILPRGWLV